MGRSFVRRVAGAIINGRFWGQRRPSIRSAPVEDVERTGEKGELYTVTDVKTNGAVLFCYDGSEGSRSAMRAAADLIERPVEVVVLTVWETIATRLALAGAFAAGLPTGGADLNEEEKSSADAVAEEGARRANEHGYVASAMTTESFEGIANAILEVADNISARLIVCGQRGRGPIRTALLGSVSHRLASHARRPVLIAPESSE
jgi:nucleotide-binding universal stress UspA family protein